MITPTLSHDVINVSFSRSFIEKILVQRTSSQRLAAAIMAGSNLGAVIQALFEQNNPSLAQEAEPKIVGISQPRGTQFNSGKQALEFNAERCAYTLSTYH